MSVFPRVSNGLAQPCVLNRHTGLTEEGAHKSCYGNTESWVHPESVCYAPGDSWEASGLESKHWSLCESSLHPPAGSHRSTLVGRYEQCAVFEGSGRGEAPSGLAQNRKGSSESS